jgi:hypothetical protein
MQILPVSWNKKLNNYHAEQNNYGSIVVQYNFEPISTASVQDILNMDV